MDNYLYNGVELPALPEWDKETYPHAMISKSTNGDYWLNCGQKPFVFLTRDNGSTGLHIDNTEAENIENMYCFKLVDGVWEDKNSALGYGVIGGSGLSDTAVWCDTDILNVTYTDDTHTAIEYGSVYLAASTPIPVSALDPTALLMGYRVGQLIRGMRGKPKEEV